MLAFWSPGWTIGGVLLALVVAAASMRRLGDLTGLPRAAAIAYVVGLGTTLAVTLAPRSPHDSYFIFDVTERRCTLYPTDVEVGELIWAAQWQFNFLLLVPVGAACAWTYERRWQGRLLVAAASVPMLIECIQFVLISLHRVCEALDVLTNLAGLLIGYSVARVARALLWPASAISGPRDDRQRHSSVEAQQLDQHR